MVGCICCRSWLSAAVVVTSGVDMALVTKNALLHGRQAALATAVGINVGIAVWTVAAAVGLAAVVAAAAAFAVIKFAGAVYLVFLGLQAATRRPTPPSAAPVAPGVKLSVGGALRQGFVSNLLNPMIAVFFTSLLPQFVDHGSLAGLLLLARSSMSSVSPS